MLYIKILNMNLLEEIKDSKMQMLIELVQFWECPLILLATEHVGKGKGIWYSEVVTIYFLKASRVVTSNSGILGNPVNLDLSQLLFLG